MNRELENGLIKLNERYTDIVNMPSYPIKSLDRINNVILEMIEIINYNYRMNGKLKKFYDVKRKRRFTIPSWRDELNLKIELLRSNNDIEEVKDKLKQRLKIYFEKGV